MAADDDAGMTTPAIAAKYGLAKSTVWRRIALYRKEHAATPAATFPVTNGNGHHD